MPVVIPEAAWARWLGPAADGLDELIGLFEPNEAVDLRIQAVSRLVNDVRKDGPALVVPLVATA